jgi:hypothetical protein
MRMNRASAVVKDGTGSERRQLRTPLTVLN